MPHETSQESASKAPPAPITQKLADFVCQTTWDDIQPIRHILECGLLDFVGLASYAAGNVDSSPAFIEAINTLSADGPGSVLGLSKRYQAQYSALLNGTLAHSMDWDDTNSTASLHPGASAISAALAQAELEASHGRTITGRDLLTARAAGYEVTCRLGRSVSDPLHRAGLHPTSAAGVFGASAAAGKLARFTPSQMEALFGAAGSMSSGSLQCFENGGWNKRFHPGIAAHNALLAVQFVKAGMHAAARAFEGKRGFLYSYGQQHTIPDAGIIEGLGERWEALDTAIKPYPSCRLNHGPIEAAYALRKQFPEGGPIPKGQHFDITVGFKAYAAVGQPWPNKIRPTNVVEGQFSVYFQFAAAWLHGRNDWDTYKLLDDAEVLALCERITVHRDDSLREGSLVTVAKLGGKSVKVEFPLGEPENPIGLADVERKVRPMLEKVYGERGAADIVKVLGGLDSLDDLSALTACLRV